MTDAPEATDVQEQEPGPGRHRWWYRQRPATRRTIRAVAAFLAAGVLAVMAGVSTATYTGSLGPHVAQYSTTLNHEIRIDTGPLGALIIDSPLPLGLGVDVRVEEIPDELSIEGIQVDAGPEDAVAGLTADLDSYAQLLADPAASIRTAAVGLVNDALGRTAVVWSLLLAVILLGRLASGGLLRTAVSHIWHRPGVAPVAVTLAVALVVLPLSAATQGSGGAGRTSTVLAGTPLEHARITGRLVSVVDHYGQYVLDAIEENSDFYAVVEEKMRDAYAQDPEPLAPSTTRSPRPPCRGRSRQGPRRARRTGRSLTRPRCSSSPTCTATWGWARSSGRRSSCPSRMRSSTSVTRSWAAPPWRPCASTPLPTASARMCR